MGQILYSNRENIKLETETNSSNSMTKRERMSIKSRKLSMSSRNLMISLAEKFKLRRKYTLKNFTSMI